MREIIQRTAQFGIHNYVALQNDCKNNWNFRNSFFFAGTGKNRVRQRSGRPGPETFDPDFRPGEKFNFEPGTRPGFQIQPQIRSGPGIFKLK